MKTETEIHGEIDLYNDTIKNCRKAIKEHEEKIESVNCIIKSCQDKIDTLEWVIVKQ